MTDLLPCPFCGCTADIVEKDVEPQEDPWYGGKDISFVQCRSCGCALFDKYFHDGFVNNEEAAKAWNTRASTQPTPLRNSRKKYSREEIMNMICVKEAQYEVSEAIEVLIEAGVIEVKE